MELGFVNLRGNGMVGECVEKRSGRVGFRFFFWEWKESEK